MINIVDVFSRINFYLDVIKSFSCVLNCSLTYRNNSYFIVVFFQYDSISFDDLIKVRDLILKTDLYSGFCDISYFDKHLVLSVGLDLSSDGYVQHFDPS